MKIFAACVLAIAIGIAASASVQYDGYDSEGGIATLINNTINKALENLSDPIVINDVALQFQGDSKVVGGLNLTKITVAGVKNLVATQIDIALPAMDLNMTVLIPDLTLNIVTYWIDLTALDLIPIYGQGTINVDITGIQLHVTGSVNIDSGIAIKNIKVLFYLGGARFTITGFLNSPEFSEILSDALTDTAVDFVDNNAELISSIVSPIIQQVIDNIFS